MKRYFLDTEFIESGPHHPIELISIALASEDGRLYYAISSEFSSKNASEWVKRNVLDDLAGPRISLKQMREDIVYFVGPEKFELWGYYCSYDFVCFCQIYETMMNLPSNFPSYINDLKPLCNSLGNPALPGQDSKKHNALSDAVWNMQTYQFLMQMKDGQCPKL